MMQKDSSGARLSLLDALLTGRVRTAPDDAMGAGRRGGLNSRIQAIARDLEMLLRTKQRHLSWPASLDAVNASVVNFGIADRSETNMGSNRAKEELRRSLELTIKQFEPRLTNVSVELRKPRPGEDRRIRFHIEAQLRSESEPITLSTILDPVLRSLLVQSSSERR